MDLTAPFGVTGEIFNQTFITEYTIHFGKGEADFGTGEIFEYPGKDAKEFLFYIPSQKY